MKHTISLLFTTNMLRRLLCVCLIAMMVTSAIIIVPKEAAVAATGDWVSSKINSAMEAKYGKYHDVTGLPAKFADYAKTQSNQFYHSTIDYHAIYCTQIDKHNWYQNPTEAASSPQFPNSNPAKQRMLAYVLAKGQRFFGEDESSVKNYTATQIAVWTISEEHTSNSTILDLILFPATGNHADTAAFAPTLEVGRLARALLDGAKTFAASSASISTLSDPIIPSFTALTEAAAKTFKMRNTGNFNEVDLKDERGVVGRDWPSLLKVVDSGGLKISSYEENTLSVQGNPKQTTTVKLTGPYGGYEVHYLSTTLTTSGGEPFQNMARFARISGNVPLYFKVSLHESTPSEPSKPEEPGAKLTKLDLKKTVLGIDGSTSKKFTFKAEFKTAGGVAVKGIMLNGKAFKSGSKLTLKHGQTAHFTKIPIGTKYKIVESDYKAAGYTSNKANNIAAGTVTGNAIATVSYINTYTQPYKSNGSQPNNNQPRTILPKTGDMELKWAAVAVIGLLTIAAASLIVWRRRAVAAPSSTPPKDEN